MSCGLLRLAFVRSQRKSFFRTKRHFSNPNCVGGAAAARYNVRDQNKQDEGKTEGFQVSAFDRDTTLWMTRHYGTSLPLHRMKGRGRDRRRTSVSGAKEGKRHPSIISLDMILGSNHWNRDLELHLVEQFSRLHH